MSSHLYNSTIGRARWFIKRFGASEIVWKPLRLLFSPVVIPFLKRQEFCFAGQTLNCFYARYNMTWVGERMVEIPIIQALLGHAPGAQILEVGNVLSHYLPINHEVVDKFEVAPGVTNIDIIQFRPSRRFDLIISISTFEHIGFDDDGACSSGEKILEAIDHCRSLLVHSGRLVITVPTGYNPELDNLLRTGRLGASNVRCLFRTGMRSWTECSLEEALTHPYRSVFPYGNALVVAEFASTEHRTLDTKQDPPPTKSTP